jgi:hypothetical protein
MGIHFSLSSEMLLKERNLEVAEAAFKEQDIHADLSMDDSLVVEKRDDRLFACLFVSNYMGYGTAENIESNWTELVKEFADFSQGAVEVESKSDDDDERQLEYIGPAKVIIATQIKNAEEEIARLQTVKANLIASLAKAGDEIVVCHEDGTLPDETAEDSEDEDAEVEGWF